MLKKSFRIIWQQSRRILILGCCFAGGWTAYAHFHPRPLLRDRWAALVNDPKSRAAPGQSGRRAEAPGSPGEGKSGNFPGFTGSGDNAGGKVAFSLDDLMAMRHPIAQGLALAEAVKTADAATCRKWLAVLEKHPHEGIRNTAVGLVMERWTALDPAGALAAAGDDYRKKSTVLRQWAHRDPAAALAAAGKDFHDDIRQGIMESDPDHAASRWKEIAPDSPFPLSMLEFALKSQVKKDPEAAMRQVPADDNHQNNQVRGNLFGSWMDQDPDAALTYAEGQTDAKVRGQLLRDFARRFPERAEPMLAGMGSGEKASLAMAVANGKAAQDPVAAARWLQSQVPVEEWSRRLVEFTRDQAGLNAEKLGGILALCPDAASRDKLLGDSLNGRTAQAVGDWLKSQPPASLTSRQQLMAFQLLTSAEAAALVPGGVSFPEQESEKMLRNKALRWNPGKPADLAADLSALPASMQSETAGMFLNQGRYLFRTEDSVHLDDSLSSGKIAAIFSSLTPATQARTALSFAWRQQSEPAAAARTLAFSQAAPDDPAAAAVYETVARNWADTDPVAAAGWIQTLAPGSVRDAAALSLIRNQAAGDPVSAAAWARTLQDPLAIQQAQQLLNSIPAAP